jgi:hypothetical protein
VRLDLGERVVIETIPGNRGGRVVLGGELDDHLWKRIAISLWNVFFDHVMWELEGILKERGLYDWRRG